MSTCPHPMSTPHGPEVGYTWQQRKTGASGGWPARGWSLLEAAWYSRTVELESDNTHLGVLLEALFDAEAQSPFSLSKADFSIFSRDNWGGLATPTDICASLSSSSQLASSTMSYKVLSFSFFSPA